MQLSLLISTLSFAFSNQIADDLDMDSSAQLRDREYGVLNEITDFVNKQTNKQNKFV